MEKETLLARTRKSLRLLSMKSRKSLGQHFLIDENVLEDIIAGAELTKDDTVFEVGPGTGVLTGELAARARRVIGIELDDNLAENLKKEMAPFPSVTVINANILDIDPSSLLNPGEPYKMVANLPYYITSPVLRHFLEAKAKPEMMLVMVQREVAKAIAAAPGQRSVLSIAVQFYGNPEIVRYVPANAFYPEPEVDSALLKITVYPAPAVNVSDEAGFFSVVRAGFTTPRKQIANSLALGLSIAKPEAQRLLGKADIDPQRRAETLTLEEWAELWKVHANTRRGS